MRFLARLFGRTGQVAPHSGSPVSGKLEVEEFGHGLASIDALGFMGHYTRSPDGRYRLIWADRSPDGGRGGYPEAGHGMWSLLRDDRLVMSGKADRPQDGKVADNGTFILSDWMSGEGLKGTFLAFSPDGRLRVAQRIAANLISNSLSPDGRHAICQTANAPGSPDSCRFILFDLESGQEIARWEVETGWAEDYSWDCASERLFLHMKGGEKVAYDYTGAMIDLEGWQRRRIAAGDLGVIRSVVGSPDKLDNGLRQAVMAGLVTAAREGDIWSQAPALRLLGELHENAGEIGKAISAYDNALAIDPRIGVARKVEKLRKGAGKADPERAGSGPGRIKKQADRMGIGHELVPLEKGEARSWRFDDRQGWTSVEKAALSFYQAQGWSGAASEGGLILTLIKAASFDRLQPRHADTFVEALYAQNVAFVQDRFDPAELVATIRRSTATQVMANWKVISATAGHTPAYYPDVTGEDVSGLFDVLGPERLAEIASVFATAPYDLRAGWPDLTLWKRGAVRFVEVKAPSDSFHATQARLISRVLLPLGFSIALAEVRQKD